MKKTNSYEREFSEIQNEIIIAYNHWQIWWIYKNERPKYVKAMNHYLQFYTFSISAHFVAMIMSLSCLIDDNYISLKTLYANLKKNNLLKISTQNKIDNKFQSVERIIKGILIIRSNTIAHISNKIESQQAFDKANLKYDDIHELIVELAHSCPK